MGAAYSNEALWGSASSSEAGARCSDPGSLTGQKAEPVGMKLTLFLSGQEKSGSAAAAAACLELRRNTGVNPATAESPRPDQSYVPHLFKGFDLLAALWRLALEHVTVVGLGRRCKLGQRRAASAVCTEREGGVVNPGGRGVTAQGKRRAEGSPLSRSNRRSSVE